MRIKEKIKKIIIINKFKNSKKYIISLKLNKL